jgi:hypothetical protein
MLRNTNMTNLTFERRRNSAGDGLESARVGHKPAVPELSRTADNGCFNGWRARRVISHHTQASRLPYLGIACHDIEVRGRPKRGSGRMRFIAKRLRAAGKGSLLLAPLLLAPLLLGGCFYSPSTSVASLPPNDPPTVLLAQQPHDQPNDAAVVNEQKAKGSFTKRAQPAAERAKAASRQSSPEDSWAAESRAGLVDDDALKQKLVICKGCTSKPAPQQKQEKVEETDPTSGWDVKSQ